MSFHEKKGERIRAKGFMGTRSLSTRARGEHDPSTCSLSRSAIGQISRQCQSGLLMRTQALISAPFAILAFSRNDKLCQAYSRWLWFVRDRNIPALILGKTGKSNRRERRNEVRNRH